MEKESENSESNSKMILLPFLISVLVIAIFFLNIYFNGGVNRHSEPQTGKVIVITGANTGLGFVAAEELARLDPYKIILACRDETRGLEAVRKIQKSANTTCVEFMRLDLNDLNSVREFAVAFSQKFDKLDTLMLNAGIMALPDREETA